MISQIDIRTYTHQDGSLSVIETESDIPFSIERIFYLYDVPNGQTRANHCSKTAQFLFIALRGSVTLELNDGSTACKKTLSSIRQGIVVSKWCWVCACDFSEDCILAVYSDKKYKAEDYINDYDEFQRVFHLGMN